MAHVNAFLQAKNDRRSVNLGGRGRNNSTGGWFNCVTADGERSMEVSAYVTGTLTYQERRSNRGDNRTANFHVRLPGPSAYVVVSISTVAPISPDEVRIEQAYKNLRRYSFAGEQFRYVIKELEAAMGEDIPDVMLPTGVSLVHALACVRLVQRLVTRARNDAIDEESAMGPDPLAQSQRFLEI
jgi:hypothetical protein